MALSRREPAVRLGLDSLLSGGWLPLLMPIVRQQRHMSHNRGVGVVLSVLVAAIWFAASAVLLLAQDSDHAAPWVDPASRFMWLPVAWLLHRESWGWHILNCLFWGFLIVWVSRLALRLLFAKTASHRQP